MRTSFHHQSEAQPPNGRLTAATSPDTPSFRPATQSGLHRLKKWHCTARSPRSWRWKVIVLPAAMDWSLTCGRTEIKLIPGVVSGKRHEPRVPSPLP